MPNPSTLEQPSSGSLESQRADRWYVTAFNNDVNTYMEVIVVLMLATDCTEQAAYDAAWEIDHFGQAVVYVNGENECRHAGEIISSVGVRVEVSPEP